VSDSRQFPMSLEAEEVLWGRDGEERGVAAPEAEGAAPGEDAALLRAHAAGGGGPVVAVGVVLVALEVPRAAVPPPALRVPAALGPRPAPLVEVGGGALVEVVAAVGVEAAGVLVRQVAVENLAGLLRRPVGEPKAVEAGQLKDAVERQSQGLVCEVGPSS
jgi:hypothetical protein